MPNVTDLIPTVEAARRLGIARTTLLLWARLGEATPAHKFEGTTGAMLWTEAEIERLRTKVSAA